jgi:hypothetical protein
MVRTLPAGRVPASCRVRRPDGKDGEGSSAHPDEHVAHAGAITASQNGVIPGASTLVRSSRAVAPEDSVIDDRLGLIFTCCHPSLSRDAQVALTLRSLLGLTTLSRGEACLALRRGTDRARSPATRQASEVWASRLPRLYTIEALLTYLWVG